MVGSKLRDLSTDHLHGAGEYKMSYRFEFVHKKELENILPQLFDILYSNMSLNYPTGCTREEDYRIWSNSFIFSIQDEARQLVLMLSENTIIGYFQYSVAGNMLRMEDLQIKKEFHCSGVFGIFYCWLVKQLPQDIQKVAAYTDKRNIKVQGILEHLGLVNCGENKNGISYLYKGDYKNLLNKYL